MNCGEKLAKCAGIGSVDEAITFARGIFKQEKAGILHKPKEKGENIILSMDESVYASGVNNIHMKLCMFLAGIIEGILRQSTSGNWVVDETKCKANGDEQCEFTCRVR